MRPSELIEEVGESLQVHQLFDIVLPRYIIKTRGQEANSRSRARGNAAGNASECPLVIQARPEGVEGLNLGAKKARITPGDS